MFLNKWNTQKSFDENLMEHVELSKYKNLLLVSVSDRVCFNNMNERIVRQVCFGDQDHFILHN